MNVAELIEKLQAFDPKAPVVIYNPECTRIEDEYISIRDARRLTEPARYGLHKNTVELH